MIIWAKLSASGEEQRLAEWHQGWYHRLVKDSIPHLTSADQIDWLAVFFHRGDRSLPVEPLFGAEFGTVFGKVLAFTATVVNLRVVGLGIDLDFEIVGRFAFGDLGDNLDRLAGRQLSVR